jgi:hypothetical protein
MGAREIQRNVAESTQNQALCALLLLYREVLRINLSEALSLRVRG